MNQNRTVRTLLLCKLNPQLDVEKGSTKGPNSMGGKATNETSNGGSENLSKQLLSIYRGETTGESAVFATIGKIDAVSIYDTLPQKLDQNVSWMKYVYEDRRRIICQSNSNFSYHPIHLVANAGYKSLPDKRFAVITLIYGVNANNSNFLSYEDYIKRQLENEIKDPEKINTFEIYNAMNICDVVLIHYTDVLKDSLEFSNSLNEKGIARKTLSLICIKVTSENSLSQDILKEDNTFSLRIEGSIRSQCLYEEYRNHLFNSICQPQKNTPKAHKKSPNREKIIERIVFDQSDFSILFSELKTNEVNNLFHSMFDNHALMAKACWDSHTAFLRNPSKNTNQKDVGNINPKNVLSSIYKKYSLKANSIDNKENCFLNDLPWFDAFYELLSVHANIDRNPVLHGPSYLIYRFVSILFDYLEKYQLEIEKRENNTSTEESYDKIFKESCSTIENAIRGWSSLTDQILRIDDLVFHGIGNNTALYNTLPECAVDFYHAMLIRVINFIFSRDVFLKVNNSTIDENTFYEHEKEYCYDFLLLPSVGREINVDQMFKVEASKTVSSNLFGLSTPVKQVYYIEFPMAVIYSPVTFFSRLVHECFHVLGDACRCRKERKDYLCRFTTELIISEIFDSFDDFIKDKIADIILPILQNEFPPYDEPNGDRCKELLKRGTQKVFSGAILNKLRTLTKNCSALYESRNYKLEFNDSQLDYILYYFKECYADLMMILLLQLTPMQYCNIFVDCEKNINAKDLIKPSQRIAVVASVLIEMKQPNWNKDAFEKGVKKWFKIELKKEAEIIGSDYFLYTFLLEYFSDLSGGRKIRASYSEEIESQICVIPCMNEVKDYLATVFDAFSRYYIGKNLSQETQKKWLEEWINQAPKLMEIQKDFKDFFFDNQLFSSDFFERISKEHSAVTELVKFVSESGAAAV